MEHSDIPNRLVCAVHFISLVTKYLSYLALALYTRSPRAFEAVKSLHILQLPSRKTLQSFTSANIQKPGVSDGYLCDQWKSYKIFCDSVKDPKPVAKGVLIFDEVKVQNGVS